ncbi:MAG TPA: zf-HC2 domain-containing protein [Bryobacteraceae bacterium]|nr:zf-HC2 domain-containing protein [Bryobacteraceae bacterium]
MHEEKPSADCKQMFELLSQYLDRELAPQSCEEIEAHLSHCPPCIEFLESLKRSMCLCRDCTCADAPPPLTEDQKAQLRAAYEKALRRPR